MSDARCRRYLLMAAPIAGLWIFYTIVVLLRTSVMGFPDNASLIERHAVTAAVGVALTLGLQIFLRAFAPRGVKTRVALGLLLAPTLAMVMAAVAYVFVVFVKHGRFWEATYRINISQPMLTAQAFTENTLIFAAWALVTIAMDAMTREGEARRRAALAALEAREAQLRALRFQLDPHFLFNALNTVSALVMRNDADNAERAIAALSSFLRITLEMNPSALVPLREELNLHELYLAIEQIRFAARLQVEVDVSAAAEAALVPSLILQPVIENVVRHALAETDRPIRLELRARAEGERLHVWIQDDGPGRSSGPGGGIGLGNIKDRLALSYASEARLDHGPRREGGYRVDLILPLMAGPR